MVVVEHDLFSPLSDASDTLPTPQLLAGTGLGLDADISIQRDSPLDWQAPTPSAPNHKADPFLSNGHSLGPHNPSPLLDAARVLNVPSGYTTDPHHHHVAGSHSPRRAPRTDHELKRASTSAMPRAQRPPPILVRRPTDMGKLVEPVALPGSASPTRSSYGPAAGAGPVVASPVLASPMMMQGGGLNISLSPSSATSRYPPPGLLSPNPISMAGEEVDRLPELVPTPSPRRSNFRHSLSHVTDYPASPLSPAWQSWQTMSPSSPSYPQASVSPMMGSPHPRQTSGERRESLGVPMPLSPLGPAGRRTSLPPSQILGTPHAPPRGFGRPGAYGHEHGHGRNGSVDPTPTHGIHARNLSLFFPQPGSGSAPVAAQSVFPNDPGSYAVRAGPDILIPAASPQLARQPFNGSGGWTFGAPLPAGDEPGTPDGGQAPRSKRRGHHHKHSLSHNFFSFLDPTVTNPALSSAASPVPQTPAHFHGSDIPPAVDVAALSSDRTSAAAGGLSPLPPQGHSDPGQTMVTSLAVLQFLLGAALWVEGQIGGWRCLAGMGYLVVFDAIGVWIKGVERRAGGWKGLRRPYGAPRVLALLHFTQSIFLLFAAVYIAKESIEQVLLGSGAHGHGHSHGHAVEVEGHLEAGSRSGGSVDEAARGFPHALLGLAGLTSLLAGAGWGTHQKLVDAVGPLFLPAAVTRMGEVLGLGVMGNPFTLTVAMGSAAVLLGSLVVPTSSLHAFDSLMSLLLTVLTSALSFPAAKAFGHVLLQTAPPASSGQMRELKGALREMREDRRVLGVERVRIWMVEAGSVGASGSGRDGSEAAWQEGRRGSGVGGRGSLGARESPLGSPKGFNGSDFGAGWNGGLAGTWKEPNGHAFAATDTGTGTAPLVLTLTVHVVEDLSDAEILDMTREMSAKLRPLVRAKGARESEIGEGEGEGEVTLAVKRGWDGLEDG